MALIPNYNAIAPSIKRLFELRDSDRAAVNWVNLYLSNWDFDENWYLSNYPDLAGAIPSKDFPSGFAHFCAIGYLEGRLPIKPAIDTTWYMTNYPDVAAAILQGTFESATQHFRVSGYNEGRLAEGPEIDAPWYARTYLGVTEGSKAKMSDCIAHFKSVGYLNGALPRLKSA